MQNSGGCFKRPLWIRSNGRRQLQASESIYLQYFNKISEMRTLLPVVVAVFGGSESRKTGIINSISLVTFPPFNGGNTGSIPVRIANSLFLDERLKYSIATAKASPRFGEIAFQDRDTGTRPSEKAEIIRAGAGP